MEIQYFEEVEEYLSKLSDNDRGRVVHTARFFETRGFSIGSKYIKKISKFDIWELRAGRVRLFLYIKGSKSVCVHAVYKKSQKLKLSDIRLAEKRSKEI
jgi:phage-related protein